MEIVRVHCLIAHVDFLGVACAGCGLLLSQVAVNIGAHVSAKGSSATTTLLIIVLQW